jgi:hypothetical protein
MNHAIVISALTFLSLLIIASFVELFSVIRKRNDMVEANTALADKIQNE